VSFDRIALFLRFAQSRDDSQAEHQADADKVEAIILFNCRYLGRAVDVMRRQGRPIDEPRPLPYIRAP
jgi:hypothetical protein